MGPGPVDSAVADAGPLIHLAEIGRLELLAALGRVVVPDIVWEETVGRGRVTASALAGIGTIQRHRSSHADVKAFQGTNDLGHLQDGELDALLACETLGIEVILTDDLAVRRIAGVLGRTPVGSVGIAVRAYRRGLLGLDDAERCIYALYDTSTLFVTRAIVDMAVEQVRQYATGNRSADDQPTEAPE